MAKTVVQEFTKGLWAEIPPFRLVLGLCPTLAVTKGVENGIGMGIATTFVLVCSNILISMLRNIIPKRVRIACYIVVIATFVTVVELVMQAFAYPLFLKLGIFIHCGQLHRIGPCRGLCRQKRRSGLFCRRTRHRCGLYPVVDRALHCTGGSGERHFLRYPGIRALI